MDQLDIRFPLGLLFLVLGLILGIYGLVADPQIYAAHSLGQNVNLWWGIVYSIFGTAVLGLAIRNTRESKE